MTLPIRRVIALAALALAVLAGPDRAGAEEAVQTLRQARLVATVAGQAQPPREISLPLHWDLVNEGQSGSAVLSVPFDVAPGSALDREPHAFFISRLGSAYELELNGVLLSGAGSLAERSDDRWSAKHPVSLSFPSRLLREHNEIVVRIRAEAGYRAGLAPIVVGPARLVHPITERAQLLRVTLPQATSVFSLLVGGFCVLLWWQQREALYAWAGFGEAVWALTVADTVIEAEPLPWPYWGLMLLLLRAAWAWSLYAITREVGGRGSRAEYWTMLSVQAAAPLCVLLMVATHSTRPLLGWYAINFAVWGRVVIRLATEAWRTRSSERFMIVLAVVAVLAASLRDAVAGRWDPSLYDESAWAKYVATLVGATLMWVVSRRFLQARAEALSLNASLSEQVTRKEQELRDSFDRLSELERSRAVLAERERILRDMHDGVGSNLATAVRQLESGRSVSAQVLQILRESMDHLKLSIDAMNMPPGDVNALLASLRYRLQPRIESAGLRVEWDVEALPRWTAGNDEAMRSLQFLVLEVVSNVLQHAGASTLSLAARADSGGIRITLSDDGKGIRGPAGSGLRSLHARADSIGVAVEISDGSPGTRVDLTLPLRPGP